jgi:hypothetical protein
MMTTTAITVISTQLGGKEDQMEESEQKVHIRYKRLRKYIRKESNDSNLIDFKSIIIQVDKSEDFSSQDLESSFS